MDNLVSILKNNRSLFEKIVPFNSRKDGLLLLDFTAENPELTDNVLEDVRSLSAYINQKLENSRSLFGIGGYGEHREVYSKSKVFDAKAPGEEPRRFHLGIDIWGKPNTVVIAPLDGIVHSFGYHDQPGNYGAIIILSHQLQGKSFHTLYGHLSLNSIKNIQEGERISKGDQFADFGIPVENGQWPPHLHFQVINDLGGWSGDYPGVCRFSERAAYLDNCPDPDIILQMMQFAKK
ncbi:MAG: peptidoglycan DD-metalloendopeptidase family protein [Chitinophagales bacterium]